MNDMILDIELINNEIFKMKIENIFNAPKCSQIYQKGHK